MKNLCLRCFQGDGNSRTVSRFVPALSIGGEFTRAAGTERLTEHRGAIVSVSAGVYLKFRRTRRTRCSKRRRYVVFAVR